MPLTPAERDKLQDYQTMMGIEAGALALALDNMTDIMALLGQHIEAIEAQLKEKMKEARQMEKKMTGIIVQVEKIAKGVHAHEPETIYVVPIKSDSEHFPPEGKLRVYRSRTGGNEWEALTKGLPQKDCYVNVLRDAMAVDSMESCGVYFGTTGGQVYGSSNGGDTWNPIVRDLPSVLSVEVQTLP